MSCCYYLSFHNEHLFVFNDKKSTQYHKKTFEFDKWNVLDMATMWMAASQKQVTNRLLALYLVLKWVLNRIWYRLKLVRCKLVFNQIHDFNCVTCGIQHITERESKKTFELFCKGPLSCWRGIRVKKTISVTWHYNCLQWVLTV